MNIHSNGGEVMEKKKFSLKAHGISSYHAAPAVFMLCAGIALTTIISDVPPAMNQAFASSVDEETVKTEAVPEWLVENDEDAELLEQLKAEKPDVLGAGVMKLNKESEVQTVDFNAYLSMITEEDAAQKLAEIQKADRNRELWEASGEVVASSNRNLYLDTYRYQRGPSNIPSTGQYTSCVPGQVISQMVPPSSLTFDENGVPENYLYCIEGKSTAYYGGYMTATGSATRPGVVAVDPREIPYGTEMWIVSADGRYVYGFARAEDTGGFIYWPKGATVDLYMNTYADCCVWGWRGVKIYVLPTSYK